MPANPDIVAQLLGLPSGGLPTNPQPMSGLLGPGGQPLPAVLPEEIARNKSIMESLGRGRGAAEWMASNAGKPFTPPVANVSGLPQGVGVGTQGLPYTAPGPVRPSVAVRGLANGGVPAGGIPGAGAGPSIAQQVAPVAAQTAATRGMGATRPMPTPAGVTAPTASQLPMASGASGVRGAIASRMVTQPEATGLARFMRPGMTLKGGAMRAGGYGLAGQLGATYITDPLDLGGANSNIDRFATGATAGAGIGAGIGSIFPGIGTGIGAGAGALIGGGLNTLVGALDDDSKESAAEEFNKRRFKLDELAYKKGMTMAEVQQLRADVEVGLEFAGDDTDARNEILTMAEQSIMAFDPSQRGITPEQMLATQAQIAQLMAPHTERARESQLATAAILDELAGQASPGVAGATRAMAQQRRADADAMALAWQQQAQTIPSMMALQMALEQQQAATSASPSTDDLATLLAGAGQQ